MIRLALLSLTTLMPSARAVDDDKTGAPDEPIPYLQRYKPTYFLMGRPITKVQLSFQVEPIRGIPIHFGYTQLMMWDLFQSFFQINELILRVYAGGRSRLNPSQGGQELTYREKESDRKFLLPLYIQIFHGYGENQLDAGENRWGLRAGLGF